MMLHPSIFAQLDYFGAPTVLIGLLICTIGRLNDLILGSGPLILRQLTLLLLTGEMRITGGAHQRGLIPRLIQHARKTKANGTLIAPCWPSAPF